MRIGMAATLVMLSSFSPALASGFENVVLSAEEGAATSADSFAPDTPMIYFSADLVDVASGSKVTISWISVDSHGVAPANYKVDEVNLDIGANENQVTSSINKPTAGWPVGTYRVDLSIDGTAADAADFVVK